MFHVELPWLQEFPEAEYVHLWSASPSTAIVTITMTSMVMQICDTNFMSSLRGCSNPQKQTSWTEMIPIMTLGRSGMLWHSTHAKLSRSRHTNKR